MAITFEQTVATTIEGIQRDLGLTPLELAGGLGVTTRTLERWRKGESLPQREARERLALLVEASGFAVGLMNEEGAREWVRDSIPKFGGLTPAEMIQAGRVDRVHLVLAALEYGIYI